MAASKNLTPTQRTLRARLAAHASWTNTNNRTDRTAAARQAAYDRFETLVDPDGALPPDVRRQRADSARKAHFTRLAMASIEARRRKREAGLRQQRP
jgi:hypothetical protein